MRSEEIKKYDVDPLLVSGRADRASLPSNGGLSGDRAGDWVVHDCAIRILGALLAEPLLG
jgi:hypothetical protein